jgi:hypothetical protein
VAGPRPPRRPTTRISEREIYRQRNVIERCFNRLKGFRGIAIRYEKTATSCEAAVTLASFPLWARSVRRRTPVTRVSVSFGVPGTRPKQPMPGRSRSLQGHIVEICGLGTDSSKVAWRQRLVSDRISVRGRSFRQVGISHRDHVLGLGGAAFHRLYGSS